MQQIRDNIKTIGTISTWLLGFLALIIAALTSFIFNDLNVVLAESNFPNLKHAVLVLLDLYLVIACGVLVTLIASFTFPDDKAGVLKKRLKSLKSALRWNISLVIFSLSGVFVFVNYFSYS